MQDNLSEIDRVLSALTGLRSQLDDMQDEQGNQKLRFRKLDKKLVSMEEEAGKNNQVKTGGRTQF